MVFLSFKHIFCLSRVYYEAVAYFIMKDLFTNFIAIFIDKSRCFLHSHYLKMSVPVFLVIVLCWFHLKMFLKTSSTVSKTTISQITSSILCIGILFPTSCSQKSTMDMLNQEIAAAEQKKNVTEKYMKVKDYVKDFINGNFFECNIPSEIVIMIERYYYGNIFLKFPQDIRWKIYFEFISIDDLRNLAISCVDIDLAKSVVNASKLGMQAKYLKWPYVVNGKLKKTILSDKYAINIFSRMFMKKNYKELSNGILTLLFKNPEFYIDLLCKINNEEIICKQDYWIKVAGWILDDYRAKLGNTRICSNSKIKKFNAKLSELIRCRTMVSDYIFVFQIFKDSTGVFINNDVIVEYT